MVAANTVIGGGTLRIWVVKRLFYEVSRVADDLSQYLLPYSDGRALKIDGKDDVDGVADGSEGGRLVGGKLEREREIIGSGV